MSSRVRSFVLIVSIVLLVIVLVYFARSYLPERQVFRSYRGNLVLICVSGRFTEWLEPPADAYHSTPELIEYAHVSARGDHRPQGKLMGIEWIGINFKTEMPCVLMISYWYLALPLAIVAVWSVVTIRRSRKREKSGHCRGCGYDLRASHDKCPECGTAVSAADSAPATSAPAIR